MLRFLLKFFLFGKGERRDLEGKQRQVVGTFSMVVVLFHVVMLSRYYWGLDPIVFLWIHLGSVGTLGFLLYSPYKKERNVSAESAILAGIMIAITVYWLINTERLLEKAKWMTDPTTIDALTGWLLILLVFEGVRRSVGLIPVLLVVAVGIYSWLGADIPLRSINKLMFFQGQHGIWGIPLNISATIIILLFPFAGILQATGTMEFVLRIGERLLGRTRGGAAKMAIVASAGYGMVSGGSPDNVAVTGVVTIPAMVRSGFKPSIAGAFESVASTGGAITPPIMGSVVFIMAALTDISYATIIGKVIIVVVIYYLSIFIQAHWIAMKAGIGGIPAMEPLPRQQMMKLGITLIIPVALLMAALAMKYTLQTAFTIALVSSATMLVLTTLGRSWRQIVQGLITGGYNAAYLVYILALASIFIQVLSMSSLDMDMVAWTRKTFGDSLFPVLVIGAILSLSLGMAGEIITSYVLAVVVVIPAFIQLGMPILGAHLFAFYFCVMAYITPPICSACFIATRFCNASYWEIGWESIKLALPLWTLPFVFVYRPELLRLQGSPIDTLIAMMIAVGAVILIGAAMRGILLKWIGTVERLVYLVAGVMLLIPYPMMDIAGAVIGGGMFAYDIIKSGKRRKSTLDRHLTNINTSEVIND